MIFIDYKLLKKWQMKKKYLVVFCILFVFLTNWGSLLGQIPSPGDPSIGTSVPLDGGVLFILLAITGILSSFFKKGDKHK